MIDDTTYLLSIMDAIQQIESYTHEGKGAFLYNRMAQDAVCVIWKLSARRRNIFRKEFARRIRMCRGGALPACVTC